ncbi:MAG TPA: uroporphyrinogen decarboxylase family protein [Chloroflexia bacterium]|nr:uroporphyrinogen decarboxylase family protein [Chloroflexia bacterium]
MAGQIDPTVLNKMTKLQRMDAALHNQPVDRPPISLWRHFYECEQTAEDLAGAMLAYHKKYDWDWMKVNPRASYHVEGWGVKASYGGPNDKPQVSGHPIRNASDWGKLKPLSTSEGVLDEQLEVIERICEALGGETYFVQTVFNPLSVAGYLLEDRNVLLKVIEHDPQALKDALEVITETFTNFSRECVKAGASGIFFATTDWASRDMLNEDQWEEWGKPYDLRVLQAVQDAPFNVLHVCKDNNLLYCLAEYPVHAINWAVGSPGNPGLRDVQLNTDKTVIGGYMNETLQGATPAEITAEARLAREQTGGRRWILGPACAIPIDCPEENIRAARAAADQLQGLV